MTTWQARAIKLCGDLPAGVLLARIAFWQTKATLQYGEGLPFIAKKHTDWMEETGLTQKQMRRAWTLLRDKGLIEVQHHLFGNRRIAHVRLHGQSACLLERRCPRGPSVGYPGRAPEDPGGHTPDRPVGPSDIERSTTGMTAEEDSPSQDITSVLGKRSVKGPGPTFDDLRRAWSTAWHRAYPGESVDGFPDSPRWRKQVKDWMRQFDDPVNLGSRVVMQWESFRDLVRERRGWEPPTRPHIRVLLGTVPILQFWEKGAQNGSQKRPGTESEQDTRPEDVVMEKPNPNDW